MAEHIDIFDLLTRIDKYDKHFIQNQSPAMLKIYQPFVVLRWLYGCSDPNRIMAINALLNFRFDFTSKDKDRFHKMCLVSSTGQSTRYNWIKRGKLGSKHLTTLDVISRFNDISFREAKDCIGLYDVKTVIDMAEELGDDVEVIKKIKTEYK